MFTGPREACPGPIRGTAMAVWAEFRSSGSAFEHWYELAEDHPSLQGAWRAGLIPRTRPERKARENIAGRCAIPGLDQQSTGTEHDARPARAYHANRADALVGSMQVLTQHTHDLQADLAIVPQEPQQIFSANEHDLRVVQQFRCDLVRGIGQGSPQSQHFSRAGDPQGQPFSSIGANGQLGPSIAQNINAADRPPLGEQDRAPGVSSERFDLVESSQRLRGHVAKEPVGTEIASQATRLNHALHD